MATLFYFSLLNINNTDGLRSEERRIGKECMIHIAEVLSHGLDLGAAEHNHVPNISEIALLRLGIEWSSLATHFPEIEARYEGVRQALSL